MNFFSFIFVENRGKTGKNKENMEKELMMEALDNRRVTSIAETAKSSGLEKAVNAIQLAIMSGEMPLGEFIRTFVKLAVKANNPKISVTVDQIKSFFDIIGYRDYEIVGNAEPRGRRSEDSKELLTWKGVMQMTDDEIAQMTGIEKQWMESARKMREAKAKGIQTPFDERYKEK